MELNIIIDDYSMILEVADTFLAQSTDAFQRLDRGMDHGVQVGANWVESPTQLQRCQVAADKLLTALETANENLAMLSAGYILSRMPDIIRVRIDTSGELHETSFE
ncbi:MAG: hypothetical protein KDI68_16630 [Gammaproteobacteria bacterium]|nr:hypothetical protein [Gammaproteobacteria bacterium]